VDVPNDVSDELEGVARNEAPLVDLRDAPTHADHYRSILADAFRQGQGNADAVRESAGPAFLFPDAVSEPDGIVFVQDERLLEHNFRGWIPGEIAAGRSPVTAITRDGHPVSICFSARSSDVAAEAGVETAEAFRARGFGSRVTAAWALAVRASRRVPLYSTSWTNHASLSLARRLGLVAYASSWSLVDEPHVDFGSLRSTHW
jgi:hypothetical protein